MLIQEILLVFIVGSFSGWIFETLISLILYKRFTKRGFLKSSYLPAYGFGAIIVLLISYLDINLFYRILSFLISTTLLELTFGMILLKRGIRVWKYDWSYNYKEIISIYSSILWVILALIFYFFIFPDFKIITEFLFEYEVFKIFVLLFYVTISIDFIARIKRLPS